MITVLHIVKTSDGARWACAQAKMLVESGVNVHVALPDKTGEAISEWNESGAILHFIDLSIPTRQPHKLFSRISSANALIEKIKPDIIHSHFVSNTLLVRLAQRWKKRGIIRIFQVPGPLHLEHKVFKKIELLLANEEDIWICGSRFIKGLYLKNSVDEEKLFLSYPSFPAMQEIPSARLRESIGVTSDSWLVGNVSYMYKPKAYLGQKTGIKRHEDIITAMQIVRKVHQHIDAVFIGGQWGTGIEYEEALKAKALHAGNVVKFAGRLPASQAYAAWREIDCAVHIPDSENCGGVIDPLFNEVAVIASNVGGLPEVIIPGETGWLVEPGDTDKIAATIVEVSDNPAESKRRAHRGRLLVEAMFDIKRTASEILEIYNYVLGINTKRPSEFDSKKFIKNINESFT